MDFENKYSKYKKKYQELKNKKTIYDLIGGACTSKKLNYRDIDSVLEFIKDYYNCAPKQTTNQYFVILYGPPASGKNAGRKNACKIIKDVFNEPETYENILHSFIDVGIDDIVTKTLLDPPNDKITVEEQLKKNIDEVISTPNKTIKFMEENKENPVIKKLKKDSDDLYFKYKNQVDEMSLVLGAFATFVKKNVFFEIAGPSFPYMNSLINTAYKWKYKIIFIYPYIENLDLLCSRSDVRALQEGRFVTCETIKWRKEQCLEGYKQNVINKDNVNSMINMYDNIVVLRYNADLTPDKFASLNRYEFNISQDNVDILDYIVKKK